MYVKFPEKKNQVVDFWVIDRLAASKILLQKVFSKYKNKNKIKKYNLITKN